MLAVRRLLPALGAVAFLAACDLDDRKVVLTITASPKTVAVVPGNFATVVVTGTIGGKAIPDLSTIDLETTVASFSEDSLEQAKSLTVAGGQARTKLFAYKSPGKAKVEAVYIDPYMQRHPVTVEVEFTTQEATKLLFHCPVKNIGGFLLSAETMRIPCSAYAEDKDNRTVPNAPIQFLAEAGGFLPERYETDDAGRSIYLYDPRRGGRSPKDVKPEGGEPSWSPDGGRTVHNPRDGLVTLVAFVPGPAFGLPDPYVDANDNDTWDDGEDFFDVDGDGEWSPSQDKVLWKAIKIVWSGELYPEAGRPVLTQQASRVQPPNATIERGVIQEFTFTLLDKNLNVLASNGLDDAIHFYVNGSGAQVSGASTARMANSYGIDIDTATFKIRNPGSPQSYTRDATYKTGVQNIRTDTAEPGQPPPEPEPFELSGTLQRTYSLDETGTSGSQISSETTPFAKGWIP